MMVYAVVVVMRGVDSAALARSAAVGVVGHSASLSDRVELVFDELLADG